MKYIFKALFLYIIFIYSFCVNSQTIKLESVIKYEHFKTTAAITLTDEYIFVLDSKTKYIYRFDQNCQFQMKFGGEDYFTLPIDIESDGFNNIYVLDSHINIVKRFDLNGVYTGISAQRLDHPSDLSRDKEGRFIIADFGSRKVKIYTPEWRLSEEFIVKDINNLSYSPTAAYINNNEIFVSDWSKNRINIYNMKGTLINSIGKEVLEQGDFYKIEGIVKDNDNRLYLLDWGNSRLTILDKDFKFIENLGSFGVGENNFRYPQDMKIVKNRLFITDSMNKCVKIFKIEGSIEMFINVKDIQVPLFPKTQIFIEHNIEFFDVKKLDININSKKIDIKEINRDNNVITIDFPVELLDKKVDFYGIYNYNEDIKIRFEKKIRLENQK
ncbi:MAG: NHL repeat-containing protein [Candidatus Muirbacterium halophilum]|nr:NHL repeat-containing protein [Candidatus Muirbacterium halophilum]MCK9475972.1 NHL repeat-containing protein [Candidatus Muirbacterium halophilum]